MAPSQALHCFAHLPGPCAVLPTCQVVFQASSRGAVRVEAVSPPPT